ncbi:DUF6714 family protein [Vibrio stylophorae]|uniref:DUF6714 family protein n=1 Tax=Vibrio stylophorae TaxID=659351 RepID=UPI001F3AF227|nr:DUF6714 family protein [Vibrio stylophorae]
MPIESLFTQIADAFPAMEKPQGMALTFHPRGCPHCLFLRDDLAEYQRHPLPEAAIRVVQHEMSCLSAAGWLWVMPSYLLHCLKYIDERDRSEIQFLIYNLAPKPAYVEETKMRLVHFNRAQLQCLVQFLQCCQAHKHWSVHCEAALQQALNFVCDLQAVTSGS